MPHLNGTGPQGAGPMTGRGKGYCILKKDIEEQFQLKGYTGLAGNVYQERIEKSKEVGNMPRRNTIGPYRMRLFTEPAFGAGAGYPLPRHTNTEFPRLIGEYGQALFSGLFAYPSSRYATRRVAYFGYPPMERVRGRGRGRGWGQRCGFRYMYWF